MQNIYLLFLVFLYNKVKKLSVYKLIWKMKHQTIVNVYMSVCEHMNETPVTLDTAE